MRAYRTWFMAGVVAMAAGLARGEEDVELKAEVQALKAEVAEMKAKEQGTWINERRKEEIKGLIHEVLSDAETRASFQDGGLLAGWNKNFFLASEDGNFMLKIEGQIQPRYIWNSAEDNSNSGGSSQEDENESGFQARRGKIGFFGHVFDPNLTYKIKAGFERSGGDFILEEAYVNYKWGPSHYIRLGQFKGRFIHEELVSSTKQQAVERTNVNEFFTLDYSQGVEVGGEYEKWNWSVIVHDGREADNVEFNADGTDLAVAGRVELLLAGNWKQFGDFAAWPEDPFGLMLGAGFDYENGEGGTNSSFDWEHMLQYTVDASLEMQPFNLYAAYIGRCLGFDDGQGGAIGPTDDDAHQWGVVVQGGVFVIPDKLDLFARWEFLNFDHVAELTGAGGNVSPLTLPAGVDDHQNIFTFGGNYYFARHDVKLTVDLVWAPEGIRAGESGGGTEASNAGDDDQVAIRGQFQLLF